MPIAVDWYQKAATAGDPWAIARLGEIVSSDRNDVWRARLTNSTKQLVSGYRSLDITLGSLLNECGDKAGPAKNLKRLLSNLLPNDETGRSKVVEYALVDSDISGALAFIKTKEKVSAEDERYQWIPVELSLLLSSGLEKSLLPRLSELAEDRGFIKLVGKNADYRKAISEVISSHRCTLIDKDELPEYLRLYDLGEIFLAVAIPNNILCGLTDFEKEQDEVFESIRPYLRSASEFDSISANLLAHYESDRGASAGKEFLKAALSGNVQAQRNIGALYNGNRFDLQSSQQSYQWSYLAAIQGHGSAFNQLARKYQNGSGIPVNDGLAIQYYREATSRGYAQAFLPLARLLAKDPAGYDEAISLFVRAYDRSSSDAEGSVVLAEMDKYGLRVGRVDRQEAYLLSKYNSVLRELAGINDTELLARNIKNLLENIRSFREHVNGKEGKLIPETKTLFIISAYLKTSAIERLYGDGVEYFKDLAVSCVYGNLSRDLYNLSFREEAVLFAKRSVNFLQDARKHINDLPDSLRECFLQVHEDRYRWLADLFVKLGRLDQAEQVLLMLRNFEYTEFVRGPSQAMAERYAHIPETVRERAVSGQIDASMATLTQRLMRAQYLTGHRETLSAEETQELGQLRHAEEVNLLQVRTTLDGVRQVLSQLRAEDARLNAGFPIDTTKNVGSACLEYNTPGCTDDSSLSTNSGSIQNILRSRVSAGEPAATILTYVLPTHTTVLLVTAETRSVHQWEIASSDLNRLILDFRHAIEIGADERQYGERLYAGLLAPIIPEITDSGAKSLNLALDRVLGFIPAAALFSGEKYLAEQFPVTLFSDTLKVDTRDRSSWQVAAFGLAKKVGDWPPLFSVTEELKGIVRLGKETEGVFNGQRWVDDDFTLRNLNDALADGYPIIHFATHFDVAGHDETSARLLLGQGDLTLASMRNLRFNDVHLMVLSACNTGLPLSAEDGNHFESAARRIYEETAVSAVLGTLWSVNDRSTAAAMHRFYEILAERPYISESASLVEVQREFISKRISRQAAFASDVEQGPISNVESVVPSSSLASMDWSRPRYWAPFVLWSN
jgi:CHAT domain-containing protein/TPR repeat protein